ncbi:MAG: SDR family NAD(P)-dependent oxidoreductase [Planctomycetota bacterium]|jgi:NAD(P)-dependent dehydrogenase (short-subunit alcohol dehydrogenase family)
MSKRTVLITGANTGLGFEAARQLAGRDWGRIFISARSEAKGTDAVTRLVEATGRPADTFGVAVFDNNQPETVRAAVEVLARDGQRFDAVVLNAGGIPPADDAGRPRRVESGLTELYAMNIGGHAVLIDGLLGAGLLSEGATVMLAGSEAARGIPAIRLDTPVLPEGFPSLDATLEAIATGAHAGSDYDNMADYGLVKLIGTVWMRQLRDRHGLRALTVSPGFTAGTEAMRNLPTIQKVMFRFVMLPLMRALGNAHDLEVGAERYIQALEDARLEAGGFYASGGTGISGPLAEQTEASQPLLGDPAFEAAVGRLVDSHVQRVRAAEPGLAAAS